MKHEDAIESFAPGSWIGQACALVGPAHEHHGLVSLGSCGMEIAVQLLRRHMRGAGEMALLVLLGRSDIDDERACQLFDLCRFDLLRANAEAHQIAATCEKQQA